MPQPYHPASPKKPTPIVKAVEQPVAVLQPLPKLEMLPYPVAPQGTYQNTYAWGNCTWYVAGRKNIPNSWGNANTWGDRAAAQGLTVSPTPVIGSIAQSSRGYAGHVAIVVAISGDEVKITEMNSLGLDVVGERWQPISDYNYIWV